MKILIVDDNIAIQEIIGEILTVDGYTIEKAGTVSDAIKKLDSFRPDGLLLDSQVGGESGYKVLDALPSDSPVRAIILTKGKEVLPRDTPFISDSIQKPFKSSELMEKVRSMEEDLSMNHKGHKSWIGKLFFKQQKHSADDGEIQGLRFGKSYVVFESEPDSVYKLAWQFMMKGYDMMVVTSGKIKMITERFKNDQGFEVKTTGLSLKRRLGYIEMSKLGTLMEQIRKFIEEKDKPVIVFDSLDEVIGANGLNNVMTMLYQIIHGNVKKISTLIVSTRDDSLTDKDKELFLHEMELYDQQ